MLLQLMISLYRIITLSVLTFNLLSLAGKGNVSELESLRLSTLSNLKKTLDCLLFYLILLVTCKSFSTCITQNYLAYLINMHHLNRAWLPSALLLHGSVKRSNWREEFVVDLRGNSEGVGYLKIAYVSLSKTVLLISCYFLPALSITPSLLMKTALIRGNCLALSANCCIVILHRYIPSALLR